MANFFRKHLNRLKRSIRGRLFPADVFDAQVRQVIERMAPLTDGQKHPNINGLWAQLRDIDVMRINVKNYGFELAKMMAPALQRIDVQGEPSIRGLVSKPTTQSDVESAWFVHWCQALGIAPVYHRKLWEFAFTLQALHEAGLLVAGKRGLGFGCGEEPLASFFAARGLFVTVSDLSPQQVAGMGWTNTGQHASTLRQAWHPDLVDEARFLSQVDHKFLDMNSVPEVEEPYDFCWSICALEHLGSIEKGLVFVEEALKTLKPGGLAIHTTEFNYSRDDETVDNWQTVLFQRRHFEDLAQRLAARGHTLLGPDFDVGTGILDGFIDVPPYAWDAEEGYVLPWDKRAKPVAHLKLSIDGIPSTCFGIIVRKALA